VGQYYTLIAGLREYAPAEAAPRGFDAPAIVGEVRDTLTEHDRRYLTLFYRYYDIQNIVGLLAGRVHFSALGNLTREELEEELKTPSRLPDYIYRIVAAHSNPDDPEYDDEERVGSIEKALYAAYYDECARSRCRFIREWYEFDRNLRNVSAAYTARRLGRPVAPEIVGEGFVADTLRRSSAADFGLGGELDYIDRVMAAVREDGNLIEKERVIDMLRWEMSDELTVFDYFNINAVLAYLAKVNIIYRWAALDPRTGEEMFQRLLAAMSVDTTAQI